MAERPKKNKKATAKVSPSDEIELSKEISYPLVPSKSIIEDKASTSVNNGKFSNNNFVITFINKTFIVKIGHGSRNMAAAAAKLPPTSKVNSKFDPK